MASIKNGDEVVGNRTRVRVVKNKVSPPFKQVEFDIIYGEGISKEGDILDMATEMNIVQKSGTWFAYGDERLGQGRDNVRKMLKERPELLAEIRAKVYEAKDIPLPAEMKVPVKTPTTDAEMKPAAAKKGASAKKAAK